MKSVSIYNAGWASFGGGEKYILTVADNMARTSQYIVTLLVDAPSITIERLSRYYNLALHGVRLEVVTRRDAEQQLALSDIGFVVSNFRAFPNRAKQKVYVLQIPYPPITPLGIAVKASHGQFREAAKDVMRSSLLRDAQDADLVLVYSSFVKDVLWKNHGIEAHVLYPAIDDFGVKATKENIILSVGRFFSGLYNDKRYDILIDAFKELCRRLPNTSWQYRLVGSCSPDRASQHYLASLKERSRGFPIYFHVNSAYEDLKRYYNQATLFWHATGYGVNEHAHPEQTEHFGMSTVEAMSASCIPVVMNKGGQREIVSHGKSGYLWTGQDELIEHSLQLIRDPGRIPAMQKNALRRFRDFDHSQFTTRLLALLQQLETHFHGQA